MHRVKSAKLAISKVALLTLCNVHGIQKFKSKIWNVFCPAIFLHFRMVCSLHIRERNIAGSLEAKHCTARPKRLLQFLHNESPMILDWDFDTVSDFVAQFCSI